MAGLESSESVEYTNDIKSLEPPNPTTAATSFVVDDKPTLQYEGLAESNEAMAAKTSQLRIAEAGAKDAVLVAIAKLNELNALPSADVSNELSSLCEVAAGLHRPSGKERQFRRSKRRHRPRHFQGSGSDPDSDSASDAEAGTNSYGTFE
jgi:hypothetical protein